MHPGFDYLLEMSMSMPGCDTDRDALREAHDILLSMDADCRVPSAVWPALPVDRDAVTRRALAA